MMRSFSPSGTFSLIDAGITIWDPRRIVSMKRRNPQIKIKQKNIYVIWQTILTG